MASSFLDRTRAAVTRLFGTPNAAPPPSEAAKIPLDDYLALEGDRIAFLNPESAAGDPRAWLRLLDGALRHERPIATTACELLAAQAIRLSPVDMLWGSSECQRFVALLRPRAGLSARLADLRDCGVLSTLCPEFLAQEAVEHGLKAVSRAEQLLSDTDLIGSRFGSVLRELERPELVTLALLLHFPVGSREHAPVPAADLALHVLERWQVEGDARRVVGFLIEQQLLMTQIAFRQDIADPQVVQRLAGLISEAAELNTISAEEHLKMLAVLTIGDLGAGGREPLTSWRAELLWRLYVDTYNRLTMAYGDQVIDADTAARTTLGRDRPADISEAELAAFLQGLPRRYLTLFEPETIYQHVRLARNTSADAVHCFVAQKEFAWELTVVSLDKPYLFSSICGALASVGADILRGQALTSRSGLVVDVFEFVAESDAIDKEALTRLLDDVIAGRVDIGLKLRHQVRQGDEPTMPVLYFDNDSSELYTVLELVSDDMPGLLYRVSRALSDFGCEVDLVLIATESGQATDVFHIRKDGAKLSDSDQLLLTGTLERAILS